MDRRYCWGERNAEGGAEKVSCNDRKEELESWMLD